MNWFYAKENYTPSELEEARKTMSRKKAYELVEKYYSRFLDANCKTNLNNEKEHIDGGLADNFNTYYSSELKEREGFNNFLGAQFIPTTDAKYEKDLRKAMILVDNDFRVEEGDNLFIKKYASVLPINFVGMVFFRAVKEENLLLLRALAENGLDLVYDLDEKLKQDNPLVRAEAFRTKGAVYPLFLMECYMNEASNLTKFDKYKSVINIFDSLTSKQKGLIDIKNTVNECLAYSRRICTNFSKYLEMKRIIFSHVLGISRNNLPEYEEELNEKIFCNTYYSTKYPLAQMCPFDQIGDLFLDILLSAIDENGNIKQNYKGKLKNFSLLLIGIDIDERVVCKRTEIFTNNRTNSGIKRSPKESKLLEYANEIVRDNIITIDDAISYLKLFFIEDDNRFESPDKSIMEKIISKFGNRNEIKDYLFSRYSQNNLLWDAIPFSILPDNYTTYEKMIAGTQILSIDFSRIDEIPKDIRSRIFDSKDCIMSILFPGLEYAKLNTSLDKIHIGRYDKNKNATILFLKVLSEMSPSLQKPAFLYEIREVFEQYFKICVDSYKTVDMVTINQAIIAYSTKPLPMDFVGEYVDRKINPDSFKEFDTQSQAVLGGYSQDELDEARDTLTISEAIELLNRYYDTYSSEILDIKFESALDIFKNRGEYMEDTLLAREYSMVARGDLLRKASIVFDYSLFDEVGIGNRNAEKCKKFISSFSYFMPIGFIKKYNSRFRDKLAIIDEMRLKEYFSKVKDNDAILHNCRKYLCNKNYRENNLIDIFKLATIINQIPLDAKSNTKGINRDLLMTMIVAYDICDFENKCGKSDIVIDSSIKRAYNRVVDILLCGNQTSYEELGKIMCAHQNLILGYYPLGNKLVNRIMQELYGLRASQDFNLGQSFMRVDIEKVLAGTIKFSPRYASTLFFKNLSNNEFLKWNNMNEEMLQKMIIIMGRNDIRTIATLNEVLSDKNNTKLREALPDCSPEDVDAFKQRLKNIRNRIFSSTEFICELIGTCKENHLDECDYIDFAKKQGYYNHRQTAYSYFKELMLYLTEEQIKDKDIIGAFKKDFSKDSRCAEYSLDQIKDDLIQRGAEAILQSKERRRQYKSAGGDFGTPES